MKKTERRIYRNIGVATIISVVIIASVPLFYSVDESPYDCQPFTCQGIDVKMETPAFRRFVNSIKENNGVLVLGTSETGNHIYTNNYPGMLNYFYSKDQKFSSFAGAGRACYVYFPVIVNNPELFSGLKILYFINPTYWRENLNKFHEKYYLRYNDVANAIYNKEVLTELNIYRQFVQPIEIQNKANDRLWKKLREPYIEIMDRLFEEKNSLKCVHTGELLKLDSALIQEHLEQINMDLNVSHEFAENHPSEFVKIGDSNFQYEALKKFIDVCADYNIEVTFFLGPYNAIYGDKYNKEWMPAHAEVVSNIKDILTSTNQKWIDGSDLSFIPGTFIDIQHHSDYGAWLISQKIATHYEKEN